MLSAQQHSTLELTQYKPSTLFTISLQSDGGLFSIIQIMPLPFSATCCGGMKVELTQNSALAGVSLAPETWVSQPLDASSHLC